jgi:hypothetical protein
MSEPIVESLADHFSRTWDMMIDAADRFPEKGWYDSSDDRMQPARIAYHVLKGFERYTWLGTADEFFSQRRFSLDWINAAASEFPGQRETVQLLQEAKAKTLEWIRHYGAEGLTAPKPLWPWTGSCVLAQGLYHLRHIQHHVAELNVELRRRGLTIVDWK